MIPPSPPDSKRTVTTPSVNLLDPVTIRADFPLFAGPVNGKPVHFLDSGASSQKPRAVIEAMSTFASHHYANVHRGAYHLSVEATDMYERTRAAAARFIGATDPNQVVLCRGTTTALNMVAFGWGARHLRPGDRILLTVMEHHANLVPWQMVAARTGAILDFVPITPDYRLDMEAFHRKIEAGGVRVVAVTGMSNVLGTLPPLDQVAAAAHAVEALVVVDGAQLVPHRPVDVERLDADFLAFSSHKMLGPTGIGVLWGKPERLEEMDPFEGGGEMIAEVGWETSTWAPVPHRFEAGTPPIIEAAGFGAALAYLDGIGMEALATHDRHLTSYTIAALGEIPSLTIHGPPDGDDRGGVISFTLGDAHPHDLATILDEEGVSVRAGHHCAKPLTRTMGVPATARASLYVYNTTDDVDALVRGINRAARIFGI